MNKKAKELKVGIITLLSIIILALGTFFVGNFKWFQETYEMDVYFDFVSGLQVGAPVRLNGVGVGSVISIEIRPEVIPPIVVTLRLVENARMKQDARVFINTLGLMGEKYVEIYGGSPEEPFLAQGAPLIGHSPVEIQDLMDASKEVAENLTKTMSVLTDIFAQEDTRNSLKNFILRLDSISKNIDEIVAGRRDDIDTFAKNLKIISENVNLLVKELDEVVSENREDIRNISSNLAETSRTIKNYSTRISNNLDKLTEQLSDTMTESRPDLQVTFQNFREASEVFKSSMEKLDVITDRLEQGEGTIGKLLTEDALYNQTMATIEKLDEAAETIQYGSRFFSGMQFEFEMRYSDRLARWRNDIRVRITPDEKKYFLIGASDIGKDVGLDLIYARREGPFDLKLGILESEAAAGLDYNIIPEKLLLGFHGIGLTEDKPRLDIHSQLRLGNYWDLDWFFIAGGEDMTRDPKANIGFFIRY